MRSLLTHLLAAILGMLVVILWRTGQADRAASRTDASGKAAADGTPSRPGSQQKARTGNLPPPDALQRSKQISSADLESWLVEKQDNPQAWAEALAVAGLMANDPDLVRRGIETDPGNSHLLFIGATLPAFTAEERLAMSTRLVEADPENALAAFIHASHLLESSRSDESIEMLRGTADRNRFDDFGIRTQLLMEEAYGAAGIPPMIAKVRSTYDQPMPYVSELRTLANSLKSLDGFHAQDGVSELQSLTASMGHRLAIQSRSGSLIGHLTGLSLEEATLAGLPEDAPSPYQGLTVAQARDAIAAERDALREAIGKTQDPEQILSTDPELLERYIDRVRLIGEIEANKWLNRELENGG